MTILEVIRKGIKYADEFELIGEVRHNTKLDIPELLQCPNGSKYFLQGVEKDLVVFPLLLSRIIEGINRDCKGKYHIIKNSETIFIIMNDSLDCIDHRYFDFANYKSIDEAKLAAITYVLEQDPK